MEQWEYLTFFAYADANLQRDALKQRFPADKSFPKYTPLALIPQLDELGAEGWELISLDPVVKGDNDDICFFKWSGAASSGTWSHTYLAVLKRRRQMQ